MEISNARLMELVAMQVSPFCETRSATISEWQKIAHELLALRKAFNEPVIYQAEINGVMSSVTKSHYDDCKKYGVKTRLLIIKPDFLE